MKSFFSIPNPFVTFAFIFVVQCEEYNPNLLRNPELESKWKLSLVGGWYSEGQGVQPGISFRNDDQDMVVTSSVSSLIIICSAHYPVYWTYDLPDVERRRVPSGYLHRTSADFQDPQTYKFYAYLKLERYRSGVRTGLYTCRSASDAIRQTTRYIFWEDAWRDAITDLPCRRSMVFGEGVKNSVAYIPPSTPYCTTSTTPGTCTTLSVICQDLPSKTVRADPNNQTITLPCAVNSPDTRLHLFKKSVGSNVTSDSIYEAVNWTNTTGITFDPKVGFILQVKEQVTPPYGIYKCTSIPTGPDERTIEVVIVNVIEGVEEERKGEIYRREGNAKYSFDTSSHLEYGHRIECCSNGTKPPKIYKRTCTTKYECETVRKQLGEFQHLDDSDIRRGNCRSSVVRPLYGSNSLITGVFRCAGDGIDVTREFYIPPATQNQPAIYYDGEISRMNMSGLISFSSERNGRVDGNELSAYNTNTSLTLTCHPSTYLFALGLRWSIMYQNNTTELVSEKGPYVIGDGIDYELRNELTVKMTKDIVSVTCYAPLSDSTKWVNKTLIFNITDIVEPKIEGPEVEEVSWLIGDTWKELVCEGTGVPTPSITWTEPMNPCLYGDRSTGYWPYANWTEYNSYRKTVGEIGKSALRVARVLPTMGGEYTCTASTLLASGSIVGSSAYKTFIVTLTDKATDVTTAHSTGSPATTPKGEDAITIINAEDTTAPPITERPQQPGPVPPGGDLGTGLIILLCVIGTLEVIIGGGLIWRKMKKQKHRDVFSEEEILGRVSFENLRT